MELRTYKLLFFRANRLVDWVELHATDHLEALEQVSKQQTPDIMELWEADTKVAVFGERRAA